MSPDDPDPNEPTPIAQAARTWRPRAPQPAPPGLSLVATPIGNLGDITLRALDALASADLIAAEDTRVTAKLLAAYAIRARVVPYHEHNAAEAGTGLIARLRQGARVALVTDAGTPLISDPGWALVRDALAAGVPVTSLPGPSAPLAALALSGLPAERFLFAGFLPARAEARATVLRDLAPVPATLVFFETGPRLAASLAAAASVLGDRPASLARELTKRHEEVRRGTLATLAAELAAEPEPRGELVLVVGPPEPASAADDTALDAALRTALATLSVKDAAATVAAATGRKRREVYARALALAASADDTPA